MSFLSRESLLVDSANRDNHDLLLMVLTGAYGSYSKEELDNALIRAAINGNNRCVSLLLDWGADSDAEDMDGDTPLMLAACNNHIKVVEMLLKAQCLVNRVSDRRRTALHMAAWVGNEKICRLLLHHGADATIREMYGDTALMLAAHRSPNVAKILAKEGGKVVVNMRNESWDTALGYATKSGHLDCVRELIEIEADVNSRNRHGETALMFATYENRPELAKMLLESGADPNLATQTGTVPLHAACKHAYAEIVDILLTSGADPNVKDDMKVTPVAIATANGNVDIVIKLARAGANLRYQISSNCDEDVSDSPLYHTLCNRQLDMARVLYRVGGYSQSELQEIYQCDQLRHGLDTSDKGHEVLEFVKQIATAPDPLRLMCSQKIRSCLSLAGGKARETISSLQLPNPLKAYLLLEDLESKATD